MIENAVISIHVPIDQSLLLQSAMLMREGSTAARGVLSNIYKAFFASVFSLSRSASIFLANSITDL